MGNLTKVSGVADADIEKIDGVAAADIEKVGGVTKAAAASGATVALCVGEDGAILYSTTAGFASGSWSYYAKGGIDFKAVCYGKQSDGTETWAVAGNNTTKMLTLSQIAIPTASGDWTQHNATGETATAVCYGHSGSTDPDTGIANFILVGNDCEYVSYFDGDVTDMNNWDGKRPMVAGMSTSKALVSIAFNNSISEPLFMAATNQGRIAKSTTGGNGDADDWVVVRNKQNDEADTGNLGTGWALSGIAFGDAVGVKWVAVSAASTLWKRSNQTSSNGDDWGAMDANEPAWNRQMRSVDTDGAGNWVAVGDDAYVWTSGDNAVSWTEAQTGHPDHALNDWKAVKYDGSSAWYMGGAAGHLMKSVDSGANWTAIDNPYEEAGGVKQINGIAFNVIRTE